jgi:hypothetical protein
LDGAAKLIIGQFFSALAAHAGDGKQRSGVIGRLLRLLRRKA